MIVGHSTTSIRETTTDTLRDKLTTTTPFYDESVETSRDTKDLTTLSDTFDVTTKKDMCLNRIQSKALLKLQQSTSQRQHQ
ncbi:hypothetical protein CEXT_777211 [Caerostris extrusa]|uniref:Uncharacterized protein n=1 Tax=Caerostris extrusa TaxID=172846 RepID=A0AAV4V618_CAEEX|nr:hypothetical protein CEXT_777211 [Caerostris extrusa]